MVTQSTGICQGIWSQRLMATSATPWRSTGSTRRLTPHGSPNPHGTWRDTGRARAQADRARTRAGREPWLLLPGVLGRRSLPRKGVWTRPGSIAHSVHIALRGLRKRWEALGTPAQVRKLVVALSAGRQGPPVQRGFVGSNPTPAAVTGEGRWFGTRATGLRCSWPQFSGQRGLVDGPRATGRRHRNHDLRVGGNRRDVLRPGSEARGRGLCHSAPELTHTGHPTQQKSRRFVLVSGKSVGRPQMLPVCSRAPQPLMPFPQKNGGADVCPRP